VRIPRLLIVDDQQTNINLLKTQFQEYDISEANNGRMALKQIKEDKPDLILLDVMMPGIDGYSVISIVRNSPETRYIPIIVVSSLGGIDEQAKALEKGADDYISKPFRPAEFKGKVKTLLRIKALHDELAAVQQLLISFAQAVDDRDAYDAGHGQRTASYAVKLARKELLQPVWQEEIKVAALLHDIGKIYLKPSLLNKAEKLTPEEVEAVNSHPVTGEKICSVLSALKPILPMIRHHHERYDGTGYPDGLKGPDIPVGARIIGVASSYVTLTSERPNRKVFAPQDALQIMRDNAGTQWDPALVELFCQIIESEGAEEQ
jgi:putative two-component system response regulator